MAITKIDGLPASTTRKVLSESDISAAKLNNQFVIKGADPVFPVEYPADKDIIVFLEYVQSTGTFKITDAETNDITGATVATPLDLSRAPLRLDGGCKLTGTILIAKGFYLIN